MSNLYDVHIESQMGKQADLEGVEVTVSFPAPTFSQGVGGPASLITRAGALRIKTGEFSGWYSAELILLTNKETGEETRYEVTRHNNPPHADGEWLNFPVMRRG